MRSFKCGLGLCGRCTATTASTFVGREGGYLQDAQAQHCHNRAFDAPVELHVPEEEDGQCGEDPICCYGYDGYGVGECRLDGTGLAFTFHGDIPVLPIHVISPSSSPLLQNIALTYCTGTHWKNRYIPVPPMTMKQDIIQM